MGIWQIDVLPSEHWCSSELYFETFFLSLFKGNHLTPKDNWILRSVTVKSFEVPGKISLCKFKIFSSRLSAYNLHACLLICGCLESWNEMCWMLSTELKADSPGENPSSSTSQLSVSGQMTQPLWNSVFSAIKCAYWQQLPDLVPWNHPPAPFPFHVSPPALPCFCGNRSLKASCPHREPWPTFLYADTIIVLHPHIICW